MKRESRAGQQGMAAQTSNASRDRLVTLLRQRERTVEELASALGLTGNAVRFHLSSLEREGAVERLGTRKAAGAGQPALVYALTTAAETSLSRAYAPVLAACLAELKEEMSRGQLLRFLERVGKRIASRIPSAQGNLASRVSVASELLNDLGGITNVEHQSGSFRIAGLACPLSVAVDADECVCRAVGSLVSQVARADVKEACDRTGRPRCCFEIGAEWDKGGGSRKAGVVS